MGEKFDKSSQDSKPDGTELHQSEKSGNPEQSGSWSETGDAQFMMIGVCQPSLLTFSRSLLLPT